MTVINMQVKIGVSRIPGGSGVVVPATLKAAVPPGEALLFCAGSALYRAAADGYSDGDLLIIPPAMAEVLGLTDGMVTNLNANALSIRLGPVVGIFLSERGLTRLSDRTRINALVRANRDIGHILYFFSAKRVDWNDGRVRGYGFHADTNTWEERSYPFPDVFYERGGGISAGQKMFRKMREKHGTGHIAPLNSVSHFDKWDTYTALLRSPTVTPYLLDSRLCHLADDGKAALDKYKTVYFKRVSGNNGREVIRVSQNGHGFQVGFFRNRLVAIPFPNWPHAAAFINSFFDGQPFVVQRAVQGLTFEGGQVDIRVLVQKDETNHWKVTARPVRFGIPGCVITSTRSGARVYDFETALALLRLTAEDGTRLRENIDELSLTVVHAIEQAFGPFGEIGIDIAIDRNLQPFFIESNAKPGKDTVLMLHREELEMVAFSRPLRYAKFLAGFSQTDALPEPQLPAEPATVLPANGQERQSRLTSIGLTNSNGVLRVERGVACLEEINDRRERICREMQVGPSEWNDWRWQLRNRISNAGLLQRLLSLSPSRVDDIEQVGRHVRWGITPYYATLIGEDEESSPIARMVLPRLAELQDPAWGCDDPMNEQGTSPCPAVTRRYPDRLVVNVTNRCASFCRFCQRRRLIGRTDRVTARDAVWAALSYVREHREIRDVLITGGDPLTLGDAYLEWILQNLRDCPHVEYVRIGTRVLGTLPQRITPELCRTLRRYRPVFVMTHFNHPMELTREAFRAAEMLADSGLPLSNQSVLLHGVNNDPSTLRCLSHQLLKAGIRPYYLFHPKQVTGTRHFYCPLDEGLAIMREFRGQTSGLAIPTYIVNAPGGLGKIPLLPHYYTEEEPGVYTLRTWQDELITYTDFPSLPVFPS